MSLPSRLQKTLKGSLSFILYLATIFIHGVIPCWQLPTLGIFYTFSARSESLAASSLFAYPSHMGIPTGSPICFGLPFNWLQALLIRFTEFGTANTYCLSSCVFLAIAFYGARQLCIELSCRKSIAAIGAFVFLCCPFIIGHRSYAGLMFGFTFIPLSILIDLSFLKICLQQESSKKSRAIYAAAVVGIKFFMIFLDGYSFMISLVFSAVYTVYGLIELWRKQLRIQRIATYLVTILGSVILAYISYTQYVPSADEFHVVNSAFLRAQSLDLATLFIPYNGNTSLSQVMPFAFEAKSWQFYGDGSNAFYNYLGILSIIAIAGLWRFRKKTRLLIIVFSGLTCLLLSVSPAVKLNSTRALDEKPETLNYASYTMRSDEVLFDTQLAVLYRKVPGLQTMRSVYRWSIGFRIAVILIVTVLLSQLLEKKRYILFTLILSCFVLEGTLVDGRRLEKNTKNLVAYKKFEADIIAPLRQHLPPDSIIAFRSSENDYLSGYISAKTSTYTYNVGGDKNMAISKNAWPEEFLEIRKGDAAIAAANQLHAKNALDYLILTNFSLRWSSYFWPPNSANVQQMQDKHAALIAGVPPAARVYQGQYLTIISMEAFSIHENNID